MDNQEAKRQIQKSWKLIYPADKKNKGIICPLCGSGSGKHGTGITADVKGGRPNYLRCWACGFKGDVISLKMQETGLDFNTVFKGLAKDLGIDIDSKSEKKHLFSNDTKETFVPVGVSTDIADYSSYYAQCTENLVNSQEGISYLESRGISLDTAIKYHLGFDPAWESPTIAKSQLENGNSWRPKPTARIILPISKNHYIARAVDKRIKKYSKMNETGSGKSGIFNAEVLNSDVETVFVTEGVFDALSIIEAGAEAIALNSTSNAQLLLNALEDKPTDATLVLCLDSDAAGQNAQQILDNGLNRLNIAHISTEIAKGYNDPNEAFCGEKEAFKAKIEGILSQGASKPDSVSNYIDLLMQGEIDKLKYSSSLKTGFEELDKLSDGLYPGLYVIAAISSLGKTTFIHQMADYLAISGSDVLFFSMEQSRLELVSKSLARITALKNRQTSVTSLSIRKGLKTYEIESAAREYKKKISDRLSIIEGNFNCNISFIDEYVRRYIRQNGCKPIVVIDYLQILQPADDNKKSTARETVDNTVTMLKRISREHDLTVFVISSINRSNYLTPIDFESLKESGGIEYTADVIWGLQLQCLNDPLFSEVNKIKEKRKRIRQEKSENPRKIELQCLKNRYGTANFSCCFDYYPRNDLFLQSSHEEFIQCDNNENPFEDTNPSNSSKHKRF